MGSSSKIQLKEKDKIYRLHRIIYNPIWSPDIYKLRSIFKKFCGLRNQFLNYRYDYATEKVEKKFGQLQEYFNTLKEVAMSCHKDFVVNKVNKKIKLNFINLFLI